MPRNSTINFWGVRTVPIRTTGYEKLQFTVVLGFTASGYKLPPIVIFKLKKVPKRKFPRDIVVASASKGTIHSDLMLSTYIPKVIQERPNRFFLKKGILFVDCHGSHIRGNVTKALNIEGLEVIRIPSRTTCDEWMSEGEKEFTKSGKYKKVLYELASGLTLNPDGSENNKMSSRLQAIVENRIYDVILEEPSSKEELTANLESDDEISDDENEEFSDDKDFIYYISGEASNELLNINKFNEKLSLVFMTSKIKLIDKRE
ncbi:2292_t:CDS:2 [Dentiscutata erythropus]|uniref:2292_t:CDS:1 n=1 Tax=Dentiscutata erythropus TaxID=1348616 RepID=A0A9N8WAQ9_9GLOM|nr:2292_t:CDS:2 [Dentiscutata erythropus]